MTELRSESSLADQKLSHEIERLKAETSQLKAPAWRSPATVLALAGLLVSALANVQQYASASRAEAKAATEATLAQQRWAIEREKLEAEIAELRRKTAVSTEDRAQIQEELRRLKDDIAIWEEGIFKNTFQLQLDEAQLAQYVSANRHEMADSQRNTVEMMKRTIAIKTAERDKLVARRAELERRLTGS